MIEIYWGALNRLILLPFFILAFVILINNYKKAKFMVSRLVNAVNQKSIFLHYSSFRQKVKFFSMLIALLFFFIALLQPQWHKKEQTIQQEGRDLLIMLDISRSMLAQDIKPNRLEFVKLKLKALLQKLKCERVGLVLFSGSSFVQCPLTSDYQTFIMFLDQVDVENIASGTTAIDGAISKVIETYKQYPNQKNKLTLLVTDGEDFSLNLKTLQQQAKQENIKIFALGVGTTQGAPIPKVDFSGKQVGHETDDKDNVALSRLNEKLLQDICATLDGRYVKMSYDDSDVSYIVNLISKFEKEKFDDKKLSLYEDQYPLFLGVSWSLLALGWIL